MAAGHGTRVLPGRTWWRGDPGYEAARLGTVWNGYKPERYPAVIVQPRSAAEVALAVRFAAQAGLKVKARSGGHNWTASFLREGAMLVDLGAMNDIVLDLERGIAGAGPAVHGAQLQATLSPRGLFFPTGHCSDVAVSGYLLQGGFGWNGPKLGLANGLVDSIEVVTAAGEIVIASATENAELFSAAHGAGAGFFGIVTRWHLRLMPKPALRVSQSLYRREDLQALLHWATDTATTLPHEVEMNVFMTPGLGEVIPGGFAFVNLACFAPTDAQAEAILRSLDHCPLKARGLMHRCAEPSTVAELYEALDRIYVKGWRYGADNMFSDAAPAEMVRMILAMVEDIPTPQSHVLWHPYPRHHAHEDTSFSILGTNYLVGYGACVDPADDDRVQRWATTHMKRFEPMAVGMQLGDENLAARPSARFLREGGFERLEALRERHDPGRRFHGWLIGERGER